MADDLERQLGQLAGQLAAVVPALERVDEKADANTTELARLAQEVSQSRKTLEDDVRRIWDRLGQGGRDFETLRLEMDRRQRDHEQQKKDLEQLKKDLDSKATKTDLDAARKELEDAKAGKKSKREWWWDLVKIVLAGLLGAAGTALAAKIF